MSFLKAHIYKHRQVGDREEAKIKLFNSDGSPFEGGGGAALTFQGGAGSPDPGVANSGAFVTLEFVDPAIFDPAPAGTYLVKLDVDWGDVTSANNGEAVAQLVHINADDTPYVVCEIRLSPTYDTDGIGDGPLDANSRQAKVDFAILEETGRFEVWVEQHTDIYPLPVWVDVKIVKL